MWHDVKVDDDFTRNLFRMSITSDVPASSLYIEIHLSPAES